MDEKSMLIKFWEKEAPATRKVISRIPCGRLGETDEVARVVEFLVDPGSSYITGDVYSINGGMAM